jgi:hypothetical protein
MKNLLFKNFFISFFDVLFFINKLILKSHINICYSYKFRVFRVFSG